MESSIGMRKGTPSKQAGHGSPLLTGTLSHREDAAGAMSASPSVFGGMCASESEEVLAATERERYQQGVRRAVQRDIQKMLKADRTYVKHAKGPPVISKAKLETLSVPKAERMHQEHQVCQEQGLKDHVEYATYKATRLQEQRAREEAIQRHHQMEQQTHDENLMAYRAARQQREQEKAAREEKEQAALQQYRRAVACYVRQQAEEELKVHRDKVERAHKVAAEKHEQVLAATFHVLR